MKTEIDTQKENPLMKRKEFWLKLEHEGKPTPGRKEILPEVAKIVKSKEDLIIIDKIFSFGGRSISKVKVFVYTKTEEMPKDKVEKMQNRVNKKKPEAEGEAAPAGDAKPAETAEKPKEEGKSEAPKEAPKEEKPAKEEKKE